MFDDQAASLAGRLRFALISRLVFAGFAAVIGSMPIFFSSPAFRKNRPA
jgi:hypothetical protein